MNEFWLSRLPLLTEDFSLRIAIMLLHFLWQGCAIGVLVFLANRLSRNASASTRYALYSAALLLLPLCVALTFAVAEVPDSWRTVAISDSVVTEAVNLETASSNGADLTELGRNERGAGNDETPLAIAPISSFHGTANESNLAAQPLADPLQPKPMSPRAQPLGAKLAPAVVLLYFIVVGLFLLRLVLAIWGGHRLRAVSNPIDEPELLRVVAFQAKKVGLRLVPVIRYCERVSVPVVVGVVRPVILLPVSFVTGLAPDQFAAIISHELAHIRRYDLLVNVLQRMVESMLFFHPVVWYISRRMSEEREACCDDLVVSSGYDPMDYVDALLRMAELCSGTLSVDAHAVAASGDHPTQLESRIWRLVYMKKNTRFRMTLAGTLVIALLTLAVLGMPVVVHQLAMADEPTQAGERQERKTEKAIGPGAETRVGIGRSEEEEVIPQPIRDPRLKDLPVVKQVSATTPAIWARDNIGDDPFVLPGGRVLTGDVIRDLNTGKELGEFDFGGETVLLTKLSSNAQYLLVCTKIPQARFTLFDYVPTKIRVWDLTTLKLTGEPIDPLPWPFHLHGMPSRVDVAADGKTVVLVVNDHLARAYGTGGETGGVYSWNMQTGQRSYDAFEGSGDQVDAVALSPNGEWLVISDRNKLTFWKWKSKEEPTKIHVGRRIISLAFSPDSRYLAEGPDSRRDIQMRDMQTMKIVRSFKTKNESPFYVNTGALRFYSDGERLIAGNAITVDERKLKIPHRLYVWSVKTGYLLRKIDTRHYQVLSLDVAPDSTKVAARLANGERSMLAVWDISEGETSAASDIKPGMTCEQVIAAKGRHYRPLHGMREGQLILVYDDISVYVENHPLMKDGGTVSRVDPTPSDIDELVNDIPYADKAATTSARASLDGAGSATTPKGTPAPQDGLEFPTENQHDESDTSDSDNRSNASVETKVKSGMTFSQVIAVKGRHYRPVRGMRKGQLILVYNDISVYVESHPRPKDGGTVSRVDPTQLEAIGELVKNIPYADEAATSSGTAPQEGTDSATAPRAVPTRRKGLEFLAEYPKLRELSLEMAEKQFLEIVKRQNLAPHRSEDGSTYSIPLPDGLVLLVMFGNNGGANDGQGDFDKKCSGIQRVGIRSRQKPSADQRKVLKAAEDAAERKLSAALDVKGDIEFVKTSLVDAMRSIENNWNISVVVDRDALKAAGVTINQKINDVVLSGITRRSILKLILEDLGLVFVIADGRLEITTKASAKQSNPNSSAEPKPPWRGEIARKRAARVRPVFGDTEGTLGLDLGLAIHDRQQTFGKGDWLAFEYYIQNLSDKTREVVFWPPTAVGRVMEVRDSDGEPVTIGAYVIDFEQEPIRITLKPNEFYGAIEGFQSGLRPDGRKLGPYWQNPRPGKYRAHCLLTVSVSGDDLKERKTVRLISGNVPFEYSDQPPARRQSSVYRTHHSLLPE